MAPPPSPEREAIRLFQSATSLYQGAREAWRTYRDGGGSKAEWDRAKDLLNQAQDRCDEAIEKHPTFERVHDLVSQINAMRRTLMDQEPE